MKLNSLALLASLESTQDKYELGVNCYTKVDCKIYAYIATPDILERFQACASESGTQAQTKCGLLKLGLNNDQVEMTLNIKKYDRECNNSSYFEAKNCTSNCFGKDKEQCLWKCVRPLKIKSQECLGKLANIPNYNATKSVECMNECDGSNYSEIFGCQSDCSKDVFDALLAKDGKPAFKSGNSSSNSLIKIEHKTFASIVLPILTFLLLL